MSVVETSSELSKIVIKSLFDKYDEDGSGILEKEEILKLLQDDMALTDESVNECYTSVDKDRDGGVSFEEFLQWFQTDESIKKVSKTSRFHKICKAAETFQQCDTDGSGSMDRQEFAAFLQSTEYKDKVDEMLNKLDEDGDGNISFKEFLGFLSYFWYFFLEIRLMETFEKPKLWIVMFFFIKNYDDFVMFFLFCCY